MAQGVRTRRLIPILPAAMFLQGCGDEPPAPDPAEPEPHEIVEAVLEQCHGPLRGGMDRVNMELRDEVGATWKIHLWLPDRMRVESTEAIDTLVADRAWRHSKPRDTARSTDLHGDDLAALTRLREQLRGLLLLPLYEAQNVSEQGTVLVLELASGERWELELDAESLPARLHGPAGEIRFADYLTTSRTRIPKRVVMEGVGEREVSFRATDVSYLPTLFARPEARQAQPALRIGPAALGTLSVGREHRPATPEVMQIPAASWLVVADPGTWQQRHDLARSGQSALFEQGQMLKGFTGFVEEGAERLMVIPFAPDPGHGNPEFAAGDHRVRRLPAHRALVVYPPAGPYAEAVADGFIELNEHLVANALQATGPIRVYPYLSLAAGVPTDDDLASVTVRLEVPIL